MFSINETVMIPFPIRQHFACVHCWCVDQLHSSMIMLFLCNFFKLCPLCFDLLYLWSWWEFDGQVILLLYYMEHIRICVFYMYEWRKDMDKHKDKCWLVQEVWNNVNKVGSSTNRTLYWNISKTFVWTSKIYLLSKTQSCRNLCNSRMRLVL